jgi:hypothetical protein
LIHQTAQVPRFEYAKFIKLNTQNDVFAGFRVGIAPRSGSMRSILAVSLLVFSWVSVVGKELEKRLVAGVDYWVLTCRPETVRVVWNDGEGKNLRTLPEAVG